jgi:hypothetical protein
MQWKTSLAAILVATTFSATSMVAPSWAAASEKAQLDKAGADVSAGKYKEGAAEFQALGEKGNPFAQCICGVMYQNGRGVPKDIHKAVDWYMKSAKQGFAGAEEHLGEIYRDGTDGIRKDNKLAANWFRRAAFHGDGKAQLALGRMFMDSAKPQESNEAKVWLARACQAPGHISDEAHKSFMQLPGVSEIAKAQDNFAFAMANLAVGGNLSRMSEKKNGKGASSAELLAGMVDKNDKSTADLLSSMSEKSGSSSGKSSSSSLADLSALSSSSGSGLSKMSEKGGSIDLSSADLSKFSEKVSANLGDKPKLHAIVAPSDLPSAPKDNWSGYSSVEKSLSGL